MAGVVRGGLVRTVDCVSVVATEHQFMYGICE
jgi:hypothetical protein